MRYTDPSGHWFIDIIFTAIDVVAFVKNLHGRTQHG